MLTGPASVARSVLSRVTRRLPGRTLAAFALTVTAAGCGASPSAPDPPPPNSGTPSGLAGTWVGTVTQSFGSPATATLTFQGPMQDGTYGGTWSYAFNEPSRNRQGSLTTSVPRDESGQILSVDVVLRPSSTPVCVPSDIPVQPHYELRLILVGARLTGDSVTGDCLAVSPGRAELIKR
jgi:hypothetical protein